jgi:hypothetical protein
VHDLVLIGVLGRQAARDKGLNIDLVGGYGRTVQEVVTALRGTRPPRNYQDTRDHSGVNRVYTGYELRGGIEVVRPEGTEAVVAEARRRAKELSSKEAVVAAAV